MKTGPGEMDLGVVITYKGSFFYNPDVQAFPKQNLYVVTVDLQANTWAEPFIHTRIIGVSEERSHGAMYAYIGDLAVWPPPPHKNDILMWSKRIHEWDSSLENGYSENMTGTTFEGLNCPYFTHTGFSDSYYIRPFSDYRTLQFVVSGYYRLLCSGYEPICDDVFRSQMTTVDIGQPGQPAYPFCADSHPCLRGYAVPQMDRNGVKRLITPEGTAFDHYTYEVLWSNPEMATANENLWTAKVDTSGNERILVWYNGLFRVFDAETGMQLGQTNRMWGSTFNVLKYPGVADRILMHNGNTINVCRAAVLCDSVTNLTCTFILQQNIVRLRWEAAAGAVTYHIYGAEAYEGEYTHIGQTPVNNHTFDLRANTGIHFFYVTATPE